MLSFTLSPQTLKQLQELSESASLVLASFKDHPEMCLQTQNLIERTSLPRRTVQNALTSLLKSGLIHRLGKGAGVRYQLIF